MELYVYYKLGSAQGQVALAAYGAACEALSAPWPRLLRRQDELRVDGLETWMEIHTGPRALQTEAALASALAPFVVGQRHVEKFLPLGLLTSA